MENNNLPKIPDTFQPDVFKSLVDKAPEIYETSNSRVTKGIEKGKELIAICEAEKAATGKISPTTDERLNNYILNCRKLLKEINEARTPVTSMFNTVVSYFTSLENSVNITKPETLPAKIQKERDVYATAIALEEKEKQRIAALKLEKDKELVNLRADAEAYIRKSFNNYLEIQQKELVVIFENTTLDTAILSEGKLKNFPVSFPYSDFSQFKPVLNARYHDQTELDAIIEDAKKGKYESLNTECVDSLTDLRDNLIEKLPSKINELKEALAAENAKKEAAKKAQEAAENAAKASAAEKERLDKEAAEQKLKADQAAAEQKRLEDEAANRKQEDANKLALENANKLTADNAKIETQKAADMAGTLFSGPMGLDVGNTTIPKIKESYEIEVLHALGYSIIAAFYFEKEGKTESIENLDKKTLGSMKTFAEKYANNNGEKIESPYLKYNEIYKSVAKK